MTEPSPVIDSSASFAAALQWGFDTAATQGARRIVCCDPDFAHWPLDDAAVLQGLTAWLRRPQRELVLLARHFDGISQRHPRFHTWRRDWVHAIPAWQAPDELAASLPTLLVADTAVSVQLIDATHWRGRATLEAGAARQWREQLDAVLQRSARGYVANTLGL